MLDYFPCIIPGITIPSSCNNINRGMLPCNSSKSNK